MTAAASRPEVLDHLSAGVPGDLQETAHWLAWRYECRDGKWTKPPFNVRTGSHGDSTDPSTWSTYDEAIAALSRGGYEGLGWALQDTGVAGIDLDGCRDPDSGVIDAWAREIVYRMQTYTEVSPSGTGLRIFLRGELHGRGHNKKLHDRDSARYPREKAGIEVYDRGRYLTITGHHLEGSPCEIRQRQEELDALVAEFWPPKTPRVNQASGTAQKVQLDDQSLLEAMFRSRSGTSIAALWDGDLSRHNNDHSSADLALMNHLTFWTNGDADRMERLFDRSALGQRDKWRERADYRNLTIDSAIEDWNGEGYKPASAPLSIKAWDRTSTIETAGATYPQASQWPEPLDEAAFHGLAGGFVKAVEPYTEADPAAILAHVLCMAGVFIGSNVYATAGDAQHPARLNGVIVGVTAKGRKGTSSQPVLRCLRLAEDTFASTRVLAGLSSGEGLIWPVRDPIFKREKVKRDGTYVYEDVEADPGVIDKRMVVLESEFASVLRMLQRDGNTLSAIVRLAWDSGDLRTMTKNSPAVATGAHISLLGHVTRDELLRYLDRSELASGFANRFLWFASRRARILPDGEGTPLDVMMPFANLLRSAANWAKESRRLVRDEDAAAIWRDVYPRLSEGATGMFGGATSRAEAQVLRLSVLYAALDQSAVIRAEHMLAALAVWRYAEDSARWVFGDSIGDPTADTILAALRAQPELTRLQIFDLFGRNESRSRIEQALGKLLSSGLARVDKRPSGGRPTEVWTRAA